MDTEYYYSKYHKLLKFFENVGLDDIDFLLYLILHFNPNISINQIYKITGIDRSRLYRKLNKLTDIGIIELSSIAPIKYKSLKINDAVKNVIYLKEKQFIDIKNEGNKTMKIYSELNREFSDSIMRSNITRYKFYTGYNSINIAIKDIITTNSDLDILIDGAKFKMYIEDNFKDCINKFRIFTDNDVMITNNKVQIKKIKAEIYPNFIINKTTCEIFLFLDINLTKKYIFDEEPMGIWTNENNYINRMWLFFNDLWNK